MKNTVILAGHVGSNPETRTTQNGAAITTLSIATTRGFKDSEGNRQTETEWHRITCFNGTGKQVAEHVTKGALVLVTGRLHYTRWTDKNGQIRYGCEIIAEQVDFLARARDKAADQPAASAELPLEELGETPPPGPIGGVRSSTSIPHLNAPRSGVGDQPAPDLCVLLNAIFVPHLRTKMRSPKLRDRALEMAICFRKRNKWQIWGTQNLSLMRQIG